MKVLICFWAVALLNSVKVMANTMPHSRTESRMVQDLSRFNQEFYPNGFQVGTSGYSHGRRTRTVIVFIHGLFSNGRYFASTAKDFYNQGYNVLNLTLPGHENGQTGIALKDYRFWLRYTETMLKYAHKWGDKVVVAGHSFGGALAVESAQKNLIDGMILLQPALKITSFCYGLSFVGQAIHSFQSENRRMNFMLGTAETAFRFWQQESDLSKRKIQIPTLLYSSKIDPLVSESGQIEFQKNNSNFVTLISHYQIHMTNMFLDSVESLRIREFLSTNFPLDHRTQRLASSSN